MLFERAELLEKKGKRILKSLSWAIDAYCNGELSDEEFDALFKILDEDYAEVREGLKQVTK